MIVYDVVRRLESEPLLEDLSRGFAAECADPAWMLGRQWQLLEHRGSDASSPVRVEYRASLVPVEAVDAAAGQDLRQTPAEAVVESEPGDFWTPGRRVAIGRRVAARAPTLPQDPTLTLAGLPVPYDVLDGTGPDGRALWRRRTELGLEPVWFGAVPPDPEAADLWDRSEFSYHADFSVGEAHLALRRHDGGTLDWFSVDGSRPLPVPTPPPEPVSVFVGRATYPGAPGAPLVADRGRGRRRRRLPAGPRPRRHHSADRPHRLPRGQLVRLPGRLAPGACRYPARGRGARLVRRHLGARSSAGRVEPVPGRRPGRPFPRELVGGHHPTAGPALDEVVLGVDEDANLLWAVERRVAGREVPTPANPPPPPPPTVAATSSGRTTTRRAAPRFRAGTRTWPPTSRVGAATCRPGSRTCPGPSPSWLPSPGATCSRPAERVGPARDRTRGGPDGWPAGGTPCHARSPHGRDPGALDPAARPAAADPAGAGSALGPVGKHGRHSVRGGPQ